jgi:hypothetical protein
MATLTSAGAGQSVNLASAQTGSGVATNIAQRRPDKTGVPALLRIVTTIGAGPTCTYLVEGSPDGSSWFALPIQDLPTGGGAPGTLTSATFVITTAATFWKLVAVDFPWTFLRVTFSANTNVTNTVDLFCY